LVAVGLGTVSARAQDARPLKWAADAEGGAPYIFKDPNDPERDIGFEVDLAQALARELKRPIEFHQYDYKKLTDGVVRKDFDFAMNGLEITKDREKQVLFSRPYYAFALQLVVRPEEEKFTTLSALKKDHGVVGTLEDTAASRLLEEHGIRHRVYDGQVEPYQDLRDGQVDAVLLDLPIALYYARKSVVMKEDPKLKFAGETAGRGYYAIAFNKADARLRDDVNAALDRLFESGEMRRILEKWGLWNAHQDEFLPPGRFYDPVEETAGDAPERKGGYLRLLLRAAWMTVQITILGFLLAMSIGLPLALLRLYAPPPLSWLATLYVEFFRGIPVLLVLVFLYYGMPEIARTYELSWDLKMGAYWVAVLGFGLNYGAYEAEIYRAGLGSVPHGQWEAAASLGMTRVATFRRIILPQAVRVILPPMTNDLVALFKDTSVVSVIAVRELSKEYQILTKSSAGDIVEISLLTAGLYLVMSAPLGMLSRRLEERWGHP
jgi:polar amino acid transport system substrate-binding protein